MLDGAAGATIGIVGLGEVGTALAGALTGGGRAVVAFDSRPGRATDGVVTTAAALAARTSTVLVAVPGTAVRAVADEVVPALGPGALYADLATKSRSDRDATAAACAARGVAYADGAIMDTVLRVGRAVEVYLSGPGADAAAALFDGVRFEGVVLGDRPSSTELKLCRSIFTKGVSALALEAMTCAHHLDLLPALHQSLAEFLARDPLAVIEAVIAATPVHGRRRANEVRDAAALLHEVGQDAPVTLAAGEVFDALERLAADQLVVDGVDGWQDVVTAYAGRAAAVVLAAQVDLSSIEPRSA